MKAYLKTFFILWIITTHSLYAKTSVLDDEEQVIQKKEYRLSDDYRVRTGTEIFSLYSVAVVHGIYTAAFVDSFYWDNNDSDDSMSRRRKFGVSGLLGSGLAVGTVFFLDHPEKMRYGVPTAISSFYTSGLLLGLFSAMVLDTHRSKDVGPDTYVQMIWGGGMLGAFVGGSAAYLAELRPGQSLLISSTTNWAGLGSLGVMTSLETDSLQKSHSYSALIGSLSGLMLSSIAVKSWKLNPSVSRVQYVNLSGSAGVLAGFFLISMNKEPDTQTVATLLTLGGLTGLGLGTWLTTNIESDGTPLRLKEKAMLPWINRVQLTMAPMPTGVLGQLNFTW